MYYCALLRRSLAALHAHLQGATLWQGHLLLHQLDRHPRCWEGCTAGALSEQADQQQTLLQAGQTKPCTPASQRCAHLVALVRACRALRLGRAARFCFSWAGTPAAGVAASLAPLGAFEEAAWRQNRSSTFLTPGSLREQTLS